LPQKYFVIQSPTAQTGTAYFKLDVYIWFLPKWQNG